MLRRFWTVPPPVLLVVAFLTLLPPASYVLTARLQVLPLLPAGPVFASYNPVNVLFLGVCWVLAGGLLLARRWAYYLLLVFAGGLVAYNAALLLGSFLDVPLLAGFVGRRFAVATLASNSLVIVVLTGVIVYFLHRETAAPYLSLMPRGWRRRARDTIPVSVTFAAEGGRSGSARVVNISPSGLYLPIERADLLRAGESLELTIDTTEGSDQQSARLAGQVLRTYVDESGQAGVAVSFVAGRGHAGERARLASFLREHYAPRFFLSDAVVFQRMAEELPASKEHQGSLYNISQSGVYVCTDVAVAAGDTLRLVLPGKRLQLFVRVLWTNPRGDYGKAAGFGAHILRARPHWLFRLWNLRLQLFGQTVR